jgi:hypothetical protein
VYLQGELIDFGLKGRLFIAECNTRILKDWNVNRLESKKCSLLFVMRIGYWHPNGYDNRNGYTTNRWYYLPTKHALPLENKESAILATKHMFKQKSGKGLQSTQYKPGLTS